VSVYRLPSSHTCSALLNGKGFSLAERGKVDLPRGFSLHALNKNKEEGKWR
jgi:hypothetical protein